MTTAEHLWPWDAVSGYAVSMQNGMQQPGSKLAASTTTISRWHQDPSLVHCDDAPMPATHDAA